MKSGTKTLIEDARRLVHPFRVDYGRKFRLGDFDPGDTRGFKSAEHAADLLQQGVHLLSEMQEKLYAQDRWAVLLIFQAMDAAGKDSAIKHVMSGVNPQGCQVYSFKSPSETELNHDFMWRCMQVLPERGRIGIFNRSYYEESLVVRVHAELLAKERIPAKLVGKDIWNERYEAINSFERYLARNGIVVCKFFLHVSKGEQKKRFMRRLDEPEKNWKFSANDVRERQYWDKYMEVYEDVIRHTAVPAAPWFVVPADNKWFTRLIVAAAIVKTMEDLNLEFPKTDSERLKDIKRARKALLA
ncbi:MAG TPA: polyphosphate kinase 2 family protein, partial [Candidatus Binataceae bacterium]